MDSTGAKGFEEEWEIEVKVKGVVEVKSWLESNRSRGGPRTSHGLRQARWIEFTGLEIQRTELSRVSLDEGNEISELRY